MTMLYFPARTGHRWTLIDHLTAWIVYLGTSPADHMSTPADPADTAPAAGATTSSALDTPDLEAMFREVHPRVYAYVRYRIADLNEAEDLTSEILERALTHLASYDRRKGAFSTWLFRIARNTLINHLKRQQRQGRHQVDLGEGMEDLATDAPSPEQALILKEQIARMLECVRTLSPRQQEILSLRFAGGLRNREIAQVLNMNERTVSVTLLRALRKLRAQLTAAQLTEPRVTAKQPGESGP